MPGWRKQRSESCMDKPRNARDWQQPPEAWRKAQKRPQSLQLWWHLGFRFLASWTEKEYIFVVFITHFLVICYSSPGKSSCFFQIRPGSSPIHFHSIGYFLLNSVISQYINIFKSIFIAPLKWKPCENRLCGVLLTIVTIIKTVQSATKYFLNKRKRKWMIRLMNARREQSTYNFGLRVWEKRAPESKTKISLSISLCHRTVSLPSLNLSLSLSLACAKLDSEHLSF